MKILMVNKNRNNKLSAHVLVIDDDKRLNKLLQKFLNEHNHSVDTALDAKSAKIKMSCVEYDIIILDIMMPGETGLELLPYIQQKYTTPVLMLSAMKDTKHKIEGLEKGADDYLPKPFEPKELILRIQNIINKTVKTEQKRVIEFENVKIDLNKLLIIKSSKEFKINSTEKTILEKMINNPGKTFSREDIGKLINLDKERSIDVIITRLRKKIEIDPKNPKFLQTIRGAGYVLWIE